MFDPKITKKEWVLYECCNTNHQGYSVLVVGIGDISHIEVPICDEDMNHLLKPDDAKAIAAVPELLEVYKAAKNLIDPKMDTSSLKIRHVVLSRAIKKLEDKYG